MTAVTAAMVKELRERTGVGMSKCKEALDEAKGDMEQAISILRKAGMASAVKKQGRETKEGVVIAKESNGAIAIVEVNAETDFVVKNDQFQAFAQSIAEEAAATKPASLEAFLEQKYSKDPSITIDQYRSLIIQQIGENIQISKLKILPKTAGNTVGIYSHLGGKILTLCEISGSEGQPEVQTLARDIAMHIAATSPEYLRPENIPADIVEREREIAKGQVQNKPANIIDKIVDGKLGAFYDAICLIRQKFVKDDSLTIQELVNKQAQLLRKDLELVNFCRFTVGQG